MPLVNICIDERWPEYHICEPRNNGYDIELTDDELEMIYAATGAYSEAQALLGDIYAELRGDDEL